MAKHKNKQQQQSYKGEGHKLTAKRECTPFATMAKKQGDSRAETANPKAARAKNADIGEARVGATSREGNTLDARETSKGKARAAGAKHDPQVQTTSRKGKVQATAEKPKPQQQSMSQDGEARATTAKHKLLPP